MTFTPLTTFQGMSAEELQAFVAGRDVIIWGVGHLGRVIARLMTKLSVFPSAFCDKNPQLQGKRINNLLIIGPEQALRSATEQKAVLIIASANYRDEIQHTCHDAGLKSKQDFLLYLHLARPEAYIDLAAAESSTSQPTSDFMTLATYKNVLQKLLAELPYLSHVKLAAWSDSMRNPELAAIIEETEKHFPCTVTTSLSNTDNLEAILQAGPSQFVVQVYQLEMNDFNSETQVPINLLKTNLQILARILAEETPHTDVKIMFHCYRHNQDTLDELTEFCCQLGLKLVTAIGYGSPYEKILNYSSSDAGKPAMDNIKPFLAWDLDLALRLAKQDQNAACLCQRIFPIIRSDLSVAQCEVYADIKLVDNFLLHKMDELIELRHHHPHCHTCQAQALHRLDIDILMRRYPQQKLLLSKSTL